MKTRTNRNIATTFAGVLLAGLLAPWSALAAGEEVTVLLPGGVPMVLVRVPAGTFMMGSPEDERGDVFENETLHEVTLTQDYYVGKTEVTQQQWAAVMGQSIPAGCNDVNVGDDYPATCINWNDIAGPGGFIETLNDIMETQSFRLPTEAEWERAARAGTSTRFSHGDVLECSDDCDACSTHDHYMAWCGNSPNGAHLAGSHQPNAFGLHDMHGNHWEWVQDFYTDDLGAGPVIDPTGPGAGGDRVIRGGDWGGEANFARSASRVSANPNSERNAGFGFRVAASEIDGLAIQWNPGLNGNWWNADRSGEGAQIDVSVLAGGVPVLVVNMYSYDSEGNQIFLIAVGAADGNTSEVDVFITEGGLWGPAFDPGLVNETEWGTGVLTVNSCNSIDLVLTPNATYQAEGYSDHAYELVRLTIPATACPADSSG